MTTTDRRARAAAYRASATRLRRAADRARTIAERPDRHPPPERIDGTPTTDQIAAVLALYPRLARNYAAQLDQLADLHDRHATHLTRSTQP